VALLQVTAKAILLGRNCLGKTIGEPTKDRDDTGLRLDGITVGDAISALSIGTRSDFANSLLETVEWLWHAWGKRFDKSVPLNTESVLGLLPAHAGSHTDTAPPPFALLFLVSNGLVHFNSVDLVDRILACWDA
jgi:hypothetical protein